MKIINQVAIHAPPQQVFYWLEEPDRAKKWMTSVTHSEIIHEEPEKVGTTFKEYIEEGGRGTEMRGVVTGFVPNELFAVRLEGAQSSVDVRFELTREESVTLLTRHVDLRLKGMLKLFGLFLGPAIRRKVAKQARIEFLALKKICEPKTNPDST